MSILYAVIGIHKSVKTPIEKSA